MMKKLLVVALAAVFALAMGLVGCGGGGPSQEEINEAFVGHWELVDSNDSELDADEIEMLKAIGMVATLDLEEDGTATMDLYGSGGSGTWEATDTANGTFKYEGDSAPLTIENGKLSLDADGTVIIWERTSNTPSPGAAGAAGAAGTAAGSAAAGLDNAEDDVPEGYGVSGNGYVPSGDTGKVPINQVLADDEYCKIEVISAGEDFEYDPGILLRFTNKTDGQVLFGLNYDTWTVDGKDAEPVMIEWVDPGDTIDTFMWWDSAETLNGAGFAGLKNVKGQLRVEDTASGDVLKYYDFTYAG